MNIIIIILCILVMTMIAYVNVKYGYVENFGKSETNVLKLNIDNLHVLKRDKEYQELINNIIDKKKFLFTAEELKILKNKYQLYNVFTNVSNVSNVSNDKIINVTKDILNYYMKNFNNENMTTFLQDSESDNILKNMNDDIRNIDEPNYENTKFLIKNNQENYYYDIYGNKIISNTLQYLADYYSTINDNNPKYGMPVKTVRKELPQGYNIDDVAETQFIPTYFENRANIHPLDGKYTYFIIPDQYTNDLDKTNIYNIDNSRIINPHTIL